MNWVEFIKNYEICEETCEIKSKARSYIHGTSLRKIPDRILKVQKNGFVKCGLHSVKPTKIYQEVFGREYD